MTIIGWQIMLLVAYLQLNVSPLRHDANKCIYATLSSGKKTEIAIIDTGSALSWYDFRNGQLLPHTKHYYFDTTSHGIMFLGISYDTRMYNLNNQTLGRLSYAGESRTVAGIIGTSDISRFISLIDFRNNIILHSKGNIFKHMITGNESPCPLIERNGLLYLRLPDNPNPCSLLLDTGSSHTIVDSRFSAHVSHIKNDVSMLQGIQGNIMIVAKSCILGEVRIGTKRLRDVDAAVADLSSYDMIGKKHGNTLCIGLLGCDVLSKYGAIIDIESKVLYVK